MMSLFNKSMPAPEPWHNAWQGSKVTWVVDKTDGESEQLEGHFLHCEGGSLLLKDAHGHLLRAFAPGAWRSVGIVE